MMFPNYHMVQRIMEQRVREHLHEAEIRRLLRSADIHRRSWLPGQICWLLTRLGHTLVTVGERLQHYGALPIPSSGD